MKITETTAVGKARNAGKKKSTTEGGAFEAFLGDSTEQTSTIQNAAPLSDISPTNALLSLQEAPNQKKEAQEAINYGNQLLDLLDQLRIDILTGSISPVRAQNMIQNLKKNHSISDPHLKNTLQEIELRIEVEIAKLS